MPPKKAAAVPSDCDEAFWKILKKGDATKVGSYLEAKDEATRKKIFSTSNSNRNDVPLIFSVNQGTEDVVEVLVKHGANVNTCEGRGEKQAALLIACWHGDDVMVQTLVRLGAKLDVVDNKSQGVFHACARMGEDSLAEWLFEQDGFENYNRRVAALGAKDTDGATPLHYAAGEAGNDSKAMKLTEYFIKTLTMAIEHDASCTSEVKAVLNSTTKGTKVTPFHLLLSGEVDNKYVASVSIDMVALGADYTIEDDDGMTPCHVASNAGMTLTLEALFGFLASLQEGKKEDHMKKLVSKVKSTGTGQTLLHVAASSGNEKGVEWVLKVLCAGQPLVACRDEVQAFVCIEDEDEEQAIHAALAAGADVIVQILVDHGASQETVDTFEEEQQNIQDEEEAAREAEDEAGGKAGDFSGQGSGGAKMSAETKQEIEAKIKKAQAARKAEAAAEREAERERIAAAGGDVEAVDDRSGRGPASKQAPSSKKKQTGSDDKVANKKEGGGISSGSMWVLFIIFFSALMPVWSIFLGNKKDVDPPM